MTKPEPQPRSLTASAYSRPLARKGPDRLDEMRRQDALRSIAYIKRCYEQRLPIPRLG